MNETMLAIVEQALAQAASDAAQQGAQYGRMYPWRRGAPTYPPGSYRRAAIEVLGRLRPYLESSHHERQTETLGGSVSGEFDGSRDSGGPGADSEA